MRVDESRQHEQIAHIHDFVAEAGTVRWLDSGDAALPHVNGGRSDAIREHDLAAS
jgi:hypothetical protein